MRKKILYFTISFMFILYGCDLKDQPGKNQTKPVNAQLNSSEYKLQLNPEMFENYVSGFETYWKIIQEVAAAEGISVIISEHPLKLKHREISFFDTPELDLRKAGFLLRQRVKYDEEHKIPGSEFTVKFRRNTVGEALAVDLSLAEGYTPKDSIIELESDIVYYSAANGKEETTFSISNSIKMDEQPTMTLGTFSKIYPALGMLEIPKETALKKVSGISADEWKVVPGKLDFGDGLLGHMDITIWILETESGQIKIPEFSFDHTFNKDRAWDEKAMLKCTSFIHKLHDAYPEWVVPGAGKAATLFDMNKH